LDVNPPATTTARRQSRASAILEAVLRQRTDILETERRVLAIAPDGALDETLEGLTHLDYRCAAHATEVHQCFIAESFDVIVGESARFGADARCALHELTRMLRPGGRLILAVAAERADFYRRRLVAEGFLVSLAHEDDNTPVLLAVRGEFAEYRRY
jgi:SAM-dependent methyltransferase